MTASYTGTVSRICLNKVRYVAIFEGTPLQPVQPAENGDATTDSFNWAALLVPIGIVGVIGVGIGAALFLRRRNENIEEDAA